MTDRARSFWFFGIYRRTPIYACSTPNLWWIAGGNKIWRLIRCLWPFSSCHLGKCYVRVDRNVGTSPGNAGSLKIRNQKRPADQGNISSASYRIPFANSGAPLIAHSCNFCFTDFYVLELRPCIIYADKRLCYFTGVNADFLRCIVLEGHALN